MLTKYRILCQIVTLKKAKQWKLILYILYLFWISTAAFFFHFITLLFYLFKHTFYM